MVGARPTAVVLHGGRVTDGLDSGFHSIVHCLAASAPNGMAFREMLMKCIYSAREG